MHRWELLLWQERPNCYCRNGQGDLDATKGSETSTQRRATTAEAQCRQLQLVRCPRLCMATCSLAPVRSVLMRLGTR